MRWVPSPDSITPVESPIGSNELGSIFSFMARRYYAESGFQDGLSSIDLWNDKYFYGKIDHHGNAVYPSETNLKQINAGASPEDPTLFLIDFVADAFTDLQGDLRDATMMNKIPGSSLVNLLKPKRAWYSTIQGYEVWMSIMYETLFTKYFTKAIERKILNFRQFVDECIRLFVQTAGEIPVTKTGYILSGYNSPRMSGFVVEVQEELRDADEKKVEYQADPAFYYYQRAALDRGFLVDKNAPWVLVADLNSVAMIKYQEKYGLGLPPVGGGRDENAEVLHQLPANRSMSRHLWGSRDVFETYFYKSYKYDIPLLKRMLITFWNSFVQAYPNPTRVHSGAARPIPSHGSPNSKTIISTTNRVHVTVAQVDRKYPWSFWLRQYFIIRLAEMGASWSSLKFERTVVKANQIRVAYGEPAALSFINKELTNIKQPDTLFTRAHINDSIRKKKVDESNKRPLSGMGSTLY